MNLTRRGLIWFAGVVAAALVGYVAVATFIEGRFPRDISILLVSLGSVILMEATLGLTALVARVGRRLTRR